MRPLLLPALLAAALAGCATRPSVPADLPPAPPAGRGAPADGDDLARRVAARLEWPDLLRGVLERDPAVAAARERWTAALDRHPQAVSLPDPMVEVLWYTENAMAPDGPQRTDTMVRQPIPFPRKLALAGELANHEADMARIAYDVALRDAATEARDAFLELGYLDRAREIVAAEREILARYAAVAAGDVAVGRTKLPEEIRARSLLEQAGYDLLLLEDLRRVEAQRVRSLLALAPDAPVGPAAEDGWTPVAATLADVLRLAEGRSQEIERADHALLMAGVRTDLARWDYAPDLSVGGVWMRNMMRDGSGRIRDSRAISLGVTVPLWVGRRNAAVHEAESLEAAAGRERQAAVEGVRTAATREYFRMVESDRLETLYRATLLPQAEKSLALAESMYAEGKGSLAGALEASLARENILLAWHRARADRGQSRARLERIAGAALSTIPSAGGRAP